MSLSDLSKDIISTLHLQESVKVDCNLQILEFKQVNGKHKVQLSDGVYQMEFYMLDSVWGTLLNLAQKFDIIQAQVMYVSKLSGCIVIRYDQNLKHTKGVIGNPVTIQEMGVIPKPNKASSNIVVSHNFEDPSNNLNSSNKKNKYKSNINSADIHIKLSSNQDPVSFNQISDLNQFERNFRIWGRVILKGELVEFQNQQTNSKGYWFMIVIKDLSGVIQGTFFGEQAVGYHREIKELEIYSFENGKITVSKIQGKTNNKYELVFNDQTVIEKLNEISEIPKFHYNLKTLKQIQGLENNQSLDIMALLLKVNPIEEFTDKAGEKKKKRVLTIRDEDFRIDITAWNDAVEMTNLSEGNIILFQNLQLREYQKQKQLNMKPSSKVVQSLPELQRAKDLLILKLLPHRNDEDVPNLSHSSAQTKALSFSNIQEIQSEGLLLMKQDMPDNTASFQNLVAFLVQIPDKLFYKSCSEPNCKKGVIFQDSGYYCSKCNKTYVDFTPWLFGQFKFQDSTSSFYVTCAGENDCRTIFGVTEKELFDLHEGENDKYKDFCFENLFCEFKIKVKVHIESYRQQKSVKYKAQYINKAESKYLGLIYSYYAGLKGEC